MSNPNPQENSRNLPDQTKGNPPGSNLIRSSRVQLQKRIEFTVELVLNDMSSYDVTRVLTSKYPITYRTALRYYYLAFAALEEKSAINIKRKKSWYATRKLRLLRDMDPAEKRTAQGVLAVNKVLDSLAAMDGIQTSLPNKLIVKGDPENPIKTEHTHTVKNEIDYTSSPTQLLESLIAIHEKSSIVEDIDHEEVKP